MVRIIAGERKGIRLKSVSSRILRPIPDKVKKAVFDILGDVSVFGTVLDLFAGTGSFGFEALSRGVKLGYFVELNRRVFQILHENAIKLGFTERVKLFNIDAFRLLRNSTKTFDLIYVAPPQYRGLAFQAASEIFARPSLVTDGGIVIVQLDKREELNITPTYFKVVTSRVWGDTQAIFYKRISPQDL
ncbi:MAG: 16S rRNA (guanine(966)-N(2))-methyltransferase RsmD [Deltaproteobacteria bacterium]|nr:16S rRNA (guanine(966)-N(2))-methyltransferase RsmD [Deltaproteobacteria bacterium]